MLPEYWMDRCSLAREILSQLPLAQQTPAWGTLGTIKPFLGFDAETDVLCLLEAISSKDIGHSAIVDVLTNRPRNQRQQIPAVFLALTQQFQDLLKSLKAALSGNLERVIVGLFKLPAHYDAPKLRAAMKRVGTDKDVLTEILSIQSNQQLRRSLAFYQQVFSQFWKSSELEVEEAIRKRFWEDSQVAMLALASVCRNTLHYFTEKLHTAMKGSVPDDKVLICILISCNETNLLSIHAELKKCYGKFLYSCIQAEMSGAYHTVLLALCGTEDL